MPHDVYVRILADGLESIRSRAGGRVVEGEEGKPYCRVEWNEFAAPDDWLRDVSRDLGADVLWLVVQKQVDAFAFQHWAGVSSSGA